MIRSRDGGCTWTREPFFKDTWATHLAVHPTDERIMYVTTGKPRGQRRLPLGRWGSDVDRRPPASTDVAVLLHPHRALGPRRLYASGQDSAGAMFISRSDDAGQTWTRLPQPLPQLQRPYDLILLLVSEASPEVLWARVSATETRDTVTEGYSYLLKSTDGGATFTPG